MLHGGQVPTVPYQALAVLFLVVKDTVVRLVIGLRSRRGDLEVEKHLPFHLVHAVALYFDPTEGGHVGIGCWIAIVGTVQNVADISLAFEVQ